MNCLVLGGNGFIGSHLVDKLLAAGHRIRVYDRRDELFRSPLSGVDYAHGGLEDREALRRALGEMDVVYHLISTTIPATSNQAPAFDVQSNVIGTLGLLEECVTARVSRVVFTSSGGTVYGVPQGNPIAETHPTDPICSYGITKLAVEKYLGLFHHLYGLEYVVLRCANAYGPRQDPHGQQGAIAAFLTRVARGEPITVWGDGSAVRDYVYVEDLVQAHLLAAQVPERCFTVNIGTGVGHSINQVCRVVSSVTGRSPSVEYQAARSVDVAVNVLDPTLSEKTLSWRSKTSLEEGISKTWKWILSILEPEEQAHEAGFFPGPD
jgi:UDP-glucose 4-epimerase